MTHRIKIDCSENSTTRTSHVFMTEPWENHPEPHHPFFVMCEDETKAEFIQLMKDSLKVYLPNDDTCLYIIHKSDSISYRWEDIESEFKTILKETFNWTGDVEVEYTSTDKLEYMPETVVVEYPSRS